jgi:hypothetical protein
MARKKIGTVTEVAPQGPSVLYITRADIERALMTWECQRRGGACQTREETLAKTVEQVAKDASAHLFSLLANPVVVS